MPTRTRRGHRAARMLAASVAALALTTGVGCGGEPETNIEQAGEDKSKQSEPEKNDKPSPSPTPTLEEEPYVQVALEYYEAFNEANDTGSVARLRELSTSDCEACRLTADRLETIYADGGSIEGGDLERVEDVDIAVEGKPDGPTYVTVVYEYQEETVVEKAGDMPEDFPVELTEERFTLKPEGGEWKITDLVSEGYKE